MSSLASYRTNPAASAAGTPEGAEEEQPVSCLGGGPPPDTGELNHEGTACDDARPCDGGWGR